MKLFEIMYVLSTQLELEEIGLVFPFGRTKNFCSVIDAHIVVGNLRKNVR